MKLHESGTALAEGVEAHVLKMPDSREAHCQASLKMAKDLDRGPYPAFASDKSWNEASGKTGSEKQDSSRATEAGTNSADGPKDHGESTRAVPGRGCRHAYCGATQGAHDPKGAENG